MDLDQFKVPRSMRRFRSAPEIYRRKTSARSVERLGAIEPFNPRLEETAKV